MQEFDTSQEEQDASGGNGASNVVRFVELLRFCLKKVVVFIAFGPGVLGVLWLIGRIFKR